MTRTPAGRAGAPLTDVRGVRVPHGTLPLLRDLIGEQAGIYHHEDRLDIMADRLIPLAIERGFDSLLDYYYLLKYDADAAADWAKAIDALSVQETYFWREADQLQALANVILPRLLALGRRLVRIWSLPCATGDEPLSIAMALEEQQWFARLPIEIHAADASESALRRARAGKYGARAFRQLPPALQAKYFEQTGPTEWTVAPALHQRITSWRRLNAVLPHERAALAGADVIFCRNMFIYFQEPMVRTVVESFADLMASPGFLCVGAAESLLRITGRLDLQDMGGAYVYVKA